MLLPMSGSMRPRGQNSWGLRVYRGVDPGTGRQKCATKTVRGSARQARLGLAAFVEETERSRIHAGTIADLLDRWLEAASPHWAVTTVRQTRSVVDHHLIPHLGDILLTDLTTARIDALYGHLLRRGGRDGRPLAPGTVHRVHVVLHRALAQAQRWEWIWTNPAGTASPPRQEPAEIRPPTPDQVMALLDFVQRQE